MSALARLDALLARVSLRERTLIAAALVGLLVVVWDVAFLRPHDARASIRAEEQEQLSEKLAELERQTAMLRATLASDPHASRREHADRLEQRVASLDQQIRAGTSGLVPPAEMTRALEALLSSRTTPRLVHLEGATPAPLVDAEAEPDVAAGSPAPSLYRHELRLEIESDFPGLLRFLSEVEALPWTFVWDQLRYEVTGHPRARVHLVLHTFSESEGWIGA